MKLDASLILGVTYVKRLTRLVPSIFLDNYIIGFESKIFKYMHSPKMMMKKISFSIFLLSVASILYLFPLSITSIHSQKGGGLVITPTVQWSEDLAGTFSYCVYEGIVTLDSTNDPQAFCVIPTSDLPFQNMQAAENDGVDTYVLNQIVTPQGLFKDGAPYSVCVMFTPSSQNVNFVTAESCEQFTNQKGHNPEEPFINLNDGVLFTNN